MAVAQRAMRDGVAEKLSPEAILASITRTWWEPRYVPVRPRSR
jgi:hypothetical protein